jgi:Trypsin-like peptidase domain
MQVSQETLMKKLSGWSVIALCLGVGTPRSVCAQFVQEGQVQKLNPALRPADFKNRGDGVLWQGVVSAPGSAYIRIHFADIKAGPGSLYAVVLRGKGERALARYLLADFQNKSEFLSDVLFTDTILVQVEGKQIPPDLTFSIDWFVHQVDTVGRLTPHSIVAVWRPVDEAAVQLRAPFITDAAKSVAKLLIGEGYACSGFLIAQNLLLTNFHCLDKSLEFRATSKSKTPSCSDIEVRFDFDFQPSPEKSVKTNCLFVRDASADLDFAALELRPEEATKTAPRRPVLKLSTSEPKRGPAIIIHHPAGLAKKVSFGCDVFPSANDQALLEHDCSTLGGSSGSPVLSPDGVVIGLHYAGPFRDDATIGEINMAIAQGAVFRNKSKPMSTLIQRLTPLLTR